MPTSAVFFLAAPAKRASSALSGAVDADAPGEVAAAGALLESDEAVAVDDAGAAAAAPAAAETATFRTTVRCSGSGAGGLVNRGPVRRRLAAAGLRAALDFGAGDFGAGDLLSSAPPFPLSAAAALLDEAFVRALVVLLLAIKSSTYPWALRGNSENGGRCRPFFKTPRNHKIDHQG